MSIAGTAGSLRLHPLHTPRALGEMALAALQVRRAARRHGAQVVHANSIRAGIVLALARPRAVDDRTRARLPAPGSADERDDAPDRGARHARSSPTRTTPLAQCKRRLPRRASRLFTTLSTSCAGIPSASIAPTRARGWARQLAGRLLLGVVAQLTPWKGQDTAIEALRLLCEQGRDAHLLFVGSAKFVVALDAL